MVKTCGGVRYWWVVCVVLVLPACSRLGFMSYDADYEDGAASDKDGGPPLDGPGSDGPDIGPGDGAEGGPGWDADWLSSRNEVLLNIDHLFSNCS